MTGHSGAEARFFLREVAAMLGGTDPANRRVALGPGPAANSKSVAAFTVLGPTSMDAENTRDVVLESHVEDSTRNGRDFLTFLLRMATPDTARDLAYIGAGAGRFVVITAVAKPADRVADYKFLDLTKALGPGWSADPLYASVSLQDLTTELNERHVEPDEPLGRRILAAAVLVASPS